MNTPSISQWRTLNLGSGWFYIEAGRWQKSTPQYPAEADVVPTFFILDAVPCNHEKRPVEKKNR